jgi:hypothetical protein
MRFGTLLALFVPVTAYGALSAPGSTIPVAPGPQVTHNPPPLVELPINGVEVT